MTYIPPNATNGIANSIGVRTLTAELALSGRAGGRSIRGRAIVGNGRPASLRLEGVAAFVQQAEGTIGYVEYAYAIQNKLATAQLRNRAGEFVAPSIGSFQAAAASADWKRAPGFSPVLTDQDGKGSWPITGASFILVQREQADAARAKAMLSFFDWCLRHGAAQAEKLDYVPLPAGVIDLVEETWKNDVRAGGKAVWP